MLITVLTPTYNRAETLLALYNSLRNQTCQSFEWLIIDDGSTDNTEKLIDHFKQNKDIDINYFKKNNGGKHTALNYSHRYIKGELVIIVDSDDCLVPVAIETIAKDWNNYRRDQRISGITYQRGDDNAKPLYDHFFRENEFVSDIITEQVNPRHVPDACEVIRTDLFCSIDFPEYEDEKFLGESYLWNQIGLSYKTVFINKVLYICNYLEGGLTKSGRKLRITCPKGGMDNSKTYFNSHFNLKQRIKNSMLFIAYGRFSGLQLYDIYKQADYYLVYLCTPLGVALYLYWKKKYL